MDGFIDVCGHESRRALLGDGPDSRRVYLPWPTEVLLFSPFQNHLFVSWLSSFSHLCKTIYHITTSTSTSSSLLAAREKRANIDAKFGPTTCGWVQRKRRWALLGAVAARGCCWEAEGEGSTILPPAPSARPDEILLPARSDRIFRPGDSLRTLQRPPPL
jgi:hypothetical protein